MSREVVGPVGASPAETRNQQLISVGPAPTGSQLIGYVRFRMDSRSPSRLARTEAATAQLPVSRDRSSKSDRALNRTFKRSWQKICDLQKSREHFRAIAHLYGNGDDIRRCSQVPQRTHRPFDHVSVTADVPTQTERLEGVRWSASDPGESQRYAIRVFPASATACR